MSLFHFGDILCHLAILATFYVTWPFCRHFMSPYNFWRLFMSPLWLWLQLLMSSGQFVSLLKKWTKIIPEFQEEQQQEEEQQQPQVSHKLQLHYVAAAKKGFCLLK